MSSLRVTLINTGWGDSVFIESVAWDNTHHFALVDCNDSTYHRPTLNYLRKYFSKNYPDIPGNGPVFDFVMLSHAHTDHGKGLKPVIREFGARCFWYPKSNVWAGLTLLLDYANTTADIGFHQAVDDSKIFPDLGDTKVSVLSPLFRDEADPSENNNSVVLLLTLINHQVLLTGDGGSNAWNRKISIPGNIRFMKVPQHGNGTMDAEDSLNLSKLNKGTILAVSAAGQSRGFPQDPSTAPFAEKDFVILSTDIHSHISYQTDGQQDRIIYTH